MKAPEEITTSRLYLRRPRKDDAVRIFERYANDVEVTRFLAWPRHRSSLETAEFIDFADAEWSRHPAGPYLIFLKEAQSLVGSTGFGFETSYRASTGYVLSRDAWGKGYAAEALSALVSLSPSLGLSRLYAYCHTEHRRSARVLEKCGFEYEGLLKKYCAFPNLEDTRPTDALSYARVF